MLKIEHLSKMYGDKKAVDDLAQPTAARSGHGVAVFCDDGADLRAVRIPLAPKASV